MNFPYSSVSYFSATDRAYAEQDPRLSPYYGLPPSRENLARATAMRMFPNERRAVLVDVLREQYRKVEASAAVHANIEALLSDTTLAVTTAHQPCLLGGPLYFVYKIMGAIRLAEELNSRSSLFRYVPVFWNGGEDHDFAEINHIHLFGKRLEWLPAQAGGSVSSMSTAGLAEVLSELKAILGASPAAQELYGYAEAAYLPERSYGEATAHLLNSLFGRYGLLVLNPMDARLKRLFAPIMKDELLRETSYRIVSESIAGLEAAGFKAQARPREINLFYLREGLRERIVNETGTYAAKNSEYRWTEADIVRELEQHPERFSPNVVMRPLYQETILPTVAWIGGGGELAYWLERKAQFEHYGVTLPVLVRRNSLIIIDKSTRSRMEKLGITESDLVWTDSEDELVKVYLERQGATVGSELTEERRRMNELYDQLKSKVRNVDASLEGSVEAERSKSLKGLDGLEARLLKAEKQKHETGINQVKALRARVFPADTLQERYDNFMMYAIQFESWESFMEAVSPYLNPLDNHLTTIQI